MRIRSYLFAGMLFLATGRGAGAGKVPPEEHPIFSRESMGAKNRLEATAKKLHKEIENFADIDGKAPPSREEIDAYRARLTALYRGYPPLYDQMLSELRNYARAHSDQIKCSDAVQALQADPPKFSSILAEVGAPPSADASIDVQLLQLLMRSSMGGLMGMGGALIHISGVAAFSCTIPPVLPSTSGKP